MFLFWGEELIQLYNDAYMPSFGVGKHPAAMGQRGRECWQEIWPIIGPQIDDVMQNGKASWNADALVPFFRNGRLEEIYWSSHRRPPVARAGAPGRRSARRCHACRGPGPRDRVHDVPFVELRVAAPLQHPGRVTGRGALLQLQPRAYARRQRHRLRHDGRRDRHHGASVYQSGQCQQDASASPSDIVGKLVADGHLVANHTQDHFDLTSLDDNSIVRELADIGAAMTGKLRS
jgi:hypothetical protein